MTDLEMRGGPRFCGMGFGRTFLVRDKTDLAVATAADLHRDAIVERDGCLRTKNLWHKPYLGAGSDRTHYSVTRTSWPSRTRGSNRSINALIMNILNKRIFSFIIFFLYTGTHPPDYLPCLGCIIKLVLVIFSYLTN